MLLLPAVNYSSRLSPPPFPSTISPQSCTADHWKVLILKFTQTPNTLGTIVLVFMQQQNHFMQKSHKTSHCAQYTHKKYETYTIIVRCCFFSQQNNIYIHHNINISATGSTHLKSGPTLKEKLAGGVNSIPFWQEGLSHANYENVHSTLIKCTKQSNIEKQQTRITTSMCSLLETLT